MEIRIFSNNRYEYSSELNFLNISTVLHGFPDWIYERMFGFLEL